MIQPSLGRYRSARANRSVTYMLTTDHRRPETDSDERDRRGFSRRAFLILSSVATAVNAGAVVGGAADERATAATPDAVLPERDDLTDGAAYVEWAVDATTAPLARHVDAAVDAFVPSSGAATGFVATADADGPLSVEAAAYPATGTDRIEDSVDEWVRETGSATVREDPATGVVEWESVGEDTVDVVRFERLPGDLVAVVSASGNEAERLRRVVARHARGMRSRASTRGG